MGLSRRTIALSSAIAAAAVAAGSAVSAATTSTSPQMSTVTFVGVYDGAFPGFPGTTHRVSVLMKRGTTADFGKNQQNYVNVESFRCASGVTVPATGAAPAGCELAATTPMRNSASSAYVSSTGRSANMSGTFAARSGKARTLMSTLRFYATDPGVEHSFGPDRAQRVRSDHRVGRREDPDERVGPRDDLRGMSEAWAIGRVESRPVAQPITPWCGGAVGGPGGRRAPGRERCSAPAVPCCR